MTSNNRASCVLPSDSRASFIHLHHVLVGMPSRAAMTEPGRPMSASSPTRRIKSSVRVDGRPPATGTGSGDRQQLSPADVVAHRDRLGEGAVYSVYSPKPPCRQPCRHPDALRRSRSEPLVYNVYSEIGTYLHTHARARAPAPAHMRARVRASTPRNPVDNVDTPETRCAATGLGVTAAVDSLSTL